jgi:glyoxylase-like metal-dependent hydrolase (beta-lactamase superfamily II)
VSADNFDHAGGATRKVDGNIVPTFRKAKYYAQRGEWDFAHNANARAKASYRPDDYEPLMQAGQLHLVEGDTEIVPGVWVRLTGGHTSHHQIITFESAGTKGVFFADIIPTRGHLTPPWVMGYDHYPLDSCDVKCKWLKQAADERWLVVFDHEPGVPWGHVQLKDGKFEFVPLPEDSLKRASSDTRIVSMLLK